MLCYSRRQQNIHRRFKDDRAELTCSDCATSFAPSAPIWLPAQVSVCVRRPMAATARIRRATHHNANSAFAQTRAFIMHSGISCVITTIYTPCASCSSLTPPRHPEAFNVWKPLAAIRGLHTVAQRPPRRLRSTTNASLLKHSVYYLLAARHLMCHMHMQQNAPPIGRGPQVILPDNDACLNTTCTFGNAIQSTQAWGNKCAPALVVTFQKDAVENRPLPATCDFVQPAGLPFRVVMVFNGNSLRRTTQHAHKHGCKQNKNAPIKRATPDSPMTLQKNR